MSIVTVVRFPSLARLMARYQATQDDPRVLRSKLQQARKNGSMLGCRCDEKVLVEIPDCNVSQQAR